MKRFWRIFKKVLIIASVLSCTCLFIIVLTSAVKKQSQLTCKSIKVKIDYESGISFLSEEEIEKRVHYLNGGVVGKALGSIDFRNTEKELERNPFVDKAEIFTDMSQCLVVNIIQKRPILRVINNDGVSYYISEKNERIPLSDNFTPHVAVVVGSVLLRNDLNRDSTVQSALYNMMTYIRSDDFLNSMIDQIYVNENGELDLIPKVGGHTILFGSADKNMEEKFDRLKIFYKEGLKETGWTKYKTINLKFEGQVVCEKQDSTNIL